MSVDISSEGEIPSREGEVPSKLAAFRPVPRTGVIYVTAEAARRGFRQDDAAWCNLGQGQPEIGALPGAPARIENLPILPGDQEYAPVSGIWELREAVASLYNQLFRRGKASQYSAENVAICGGGRVALMRACATIAPIHLGHFLPDYTAYEELLDVFRRFQPIPILLDPDDGYTFTPDQLRREILGRGLGALLLSNPCNPTGKVVQGEELAAWIHHARTLDCALLIDEFYSHYIWSGGEGIVSAAAHVADVDRDPVLIFDGLTKNWRYPGWRVSWIVGPKSVIEACNSAGSFLDGGGSRPMQRAAAEIVQYEHAMQETRAIHETFGRKRRLLVDGLRALGVRLDREPEGTFYVWGDISALPPSIHSGEDFFHAALGERVITVPGEFFDVDPGKRRLQRPSRFKHHVRFSFGPSEAVLHEALERLGKMIAQKPGA